MVRGAADRDWRCTYCAFVFVYMWERVSLLNGIKPDLFAMKCYCWRTYFHGYLPSLFARIHRISTERSKTLCRMCLRKYWMRRWHTERTSNTQRWRKHTELHIYLHRVNDLNVKMVFLFSADGRPFVWLLILPIGKQRCWTHCQPVELRAAFAWKARIAT